MTPGHFRFDLLMGLADHVWQSTLCVGAAAIIAWALRRQPAKLRYRVWLCSALKFLVPFSLLVTIGARLPWPASSTALPVSDVSIQVIVTPFVYAADKREASTAPNFFSGIAGQLLILAWAAGIAAVTGRRLLHTRRLRAIANNGHVLL